MVEGGFSLNLQVHNGTQGVTLARLPGRPAKPLPNPPNRIREVRDARGLTQDYVGRQINATGETIRKYETGEAQITIYNLQRVAKALGVRACELLNDYEGARDSEERAALSILRRLSSVERQRAIMLLAAIEQTDVRIRGNHPA